MAYLILTFTLSLALAALLTHRGRSVAVRLGIVDRPGGRRRHEGAIPRTGGWSVFLAALVTLGGITTAGVLPPLLDPASEPALIHLGLASLGVFLVGAVDDVRGLPAGAKFAVEVLVAAWLFRSGLGLGSVSLGGGAEFALPVWADLALTVFWFVGMANAFNLIDGHDGVAGGVALLALSSLSYAAMLQGNSAIAVPALALSGAILGFLLFNLPPASIFLGDAGSLFLGFALAGLGLLGVREGPGGSIPVLVPLLALGLPVLDTGLAVLRRVLRGVPIFAPDRGHIHHRLRDMGYPRAAVTLFMWGLAAVFSLAAVMLLTRDPMVTAVGLVLVLTVSVLAVRWMETPELMELARTVLRAVGQRRAIPGNVGLREAVHELERVSDPEGLDRALEQVCRHSRCAQMEVWLPPEWGALEQGDTRFRCDTFGVSWRDGGDLAEDSWEITLRLALAGSRVGRLSLRYHAGGQDALAHLDPILRKLRPTLCTALDRLRGTPAGDGVGGGADDAAPPPGDVPPGVRPSRTRPPPEGRSG
ncbi:MAG: MraY family glycosyltransferase [Longimicrobiales bacterium]|nr:MraY family glycosyltransferase [Longimicrobiales bacterium]